MFRRNRKREEMMSELDSCRPPGEHGETGRLPMSRRDVRE
jgi:hypothetical protein